MCAKSNEGKASPFINIEYLLNYTAVQNVVAAVLIILIKDTCVFIFDMCMFGFRYISGYKCWNDSGPFTLNFKSFRWGSSNTPMAYAYNLVHAEHLLSWINNIIWLNTTPFLSILL